MKRLIVGDIHGWWHSFKKIYDKEQPDEVIILGDYFDSFVVQPIDQQICYDNIIKLRNKHVKQGGKFIMLLGNHDLHYLKDSNEMYTGYNDSTSPMASYRIERDLYNGVLTIVYIDELNKTIYSHGGITNSWLKKWCNGNLDMSLINSLPINSFYFTYQEGGDSYGSSIYNGPLWVRPDGLCKDAYKDKDGTTWMQIVGHTRSNKPEWYGQKIVTIDCLPFYYMIQELEDGIIKDTQTIQFQKYNNNYTQ